MPGVTLRDKKLSVVDICHKSVTDQAMRPCFPEVSRGVVIFSDNQAPRMARLRETNLAPSQQPPLSGGVILSSPFVDPLRATLLEPHPVLHGSARAMNSIHHIWRVASILLLVGAVCLSAFALDPNQSITQLYHTSWSAKQGVNGFVTALAQTTDGYLWVGTTDGLLRFDGISFERYQPEKGSLIATYIYTLMADPDGGLWVGFQRGGVSYIRNGHVTNYSDSDGLPVSTVRSFACDRSGAIWAAVVGGFARFEGGRWHAVQTDWNYNEKSAWALLVDREGTLWVATGDEIVYLPDGEKRFQTTGIRCGKVSTLLQAPDGSILFHDDELNEFRLFRPNKGKPMRGIADFKRSGDAAIFDRDGALWCGGGDGLSRLSFPDAERIQGPKSLVEKFTEAQGLSNQAVETILEDREGNVWVGTDGGLDRFRYRNVTWFPLRGSSFTLAAGPDGDVWAGSKGSFPAVRVEDGKLMANGPTDVSSVYRDPDGTIWYGANSSLLHWQNGRLAKINVPDQVMKMSLSATPPDPITASAITKDRSGNLWVAFGGSGEFRLKDGVWTFVPILPDHPDWSAGYAFTDSRDCIWLLWGDRIAEYDHGNVRIFGAREGLTVGPPNVIAERDQILWVGAESGLVFLQDGRFHVVQSAVATGFTSVTGIVVTQNGGIWLNSGPGVVHIPQSEIETVIRHPEHKVTFDLFDLVSDLPEPIGRGDVYASGAIQASDGTVWFAGQQGVVRVDPSHIYRNALPPLVSIRSVNADDENYSPFSPPVLPALTRDLRIDYDALSLSIPERVRFRYRLEGLDKEWHDAGGRRAAFFTQLRPGKYSFRVIACNNDGVWNEQGATLNFRVAPAWFQTNLFVAACVMLFLGLLWGLYQMRLQQVHRQFNIGLEARVNERTRIARDLHDTLLQTFHGLMFQFQAVRNMLPRRTEEAIEALEDAINETEKALVQSRDAIQDLRSESIAQGDLAELLMAASREQADPKCAGADSPIFRLIEEGGRRPLSPIAKNEIYRIALEILRNAVRHSHARRIESEIRYNDDIFRLRIRDNGTGIDPKVLNEGGKSGHWGLRGVRERAERIGARLEFWSEAGAGTEVQLTVPADIAYDTLDENRGFRIFRKVKPSDHS